MTPEEMSLVWLAFLSGISAFVLLVSVYFLAKLRYRAMAIALLIALLLAYAAWREWQFHQMFRNREQTSAVALGPPLLFMIKNRYTISDGIQTFCKRQSIAGAAW